MTITSKDILIKGITTGGKVFRPSDWAERLSSALATFGSDNRMSYCVYVRPVTVDGVKCVVVGKEYEQLAPQAFHFLTNFAHDNDLQLIDGADWRANGSEAAAA